MPDTLTPPERDVEELLHRFREGDSRASRELINLSYARFLRLARRMLNGYPRLRRYLETGDVLNGAMLPLLRALEEIAPANAVHFFRLGALQVRRHLIDLSRDYFGRYGFGSKHDTRGAPADDPGGPLDRPDGRGEGAVTLEKWTEFHETVEALPAEQREVVDLLYYQGLTQGEAARMLEVDVRTVKRRWASARGPLGRLVRDLAGGGK